MQPQTIRRTVDRETYEDIASGARSFTICHLDDEIQPDDFFVFVEVRSAPQSDREIYRKVSIVVEEDSNLIVGFVPVEYGALEGMFAGGAHVLAYAVQKQDNQIEVIGPPAFLPLLAAPWVDPQQLNEHLGVQVWPEGQYSIMLKCQMSAVEAGHQEIAIQEMIVMVCTQTVEDDQTIDRFVAVDHRFLLTGALKDEFSNNITPHFGEIHHDGQLTDDQAAEMDRAAEADGQASL